MQLVKELQEPQPCAFQSYLQGDHTLAAGLECLARSWKRKKPKISGNLEGISIGQRPALRLNQLTMSLADTVRSCRPPLNLAERDGGCFL